MLRSQKTFYYRLKMVDVDGSFEYSEIRSVTFDAKGITISTYPNPTTSILKVEMVSELGLGASEADAYILDSNGKVLAKNKISTNGISLIDVNTLPSGLLILNVDYNDKIYTQKIIKVD